MFKMKVNSLAGALPANSRWRMVWNSFASPGQQFYCGMRTDANGVASFQYGRLQDAAEAPPAPNGSSGYHQVSVTVR